MTVELRVLRGARAGQREQFAKPLIALGRNPLCDFRFDPQLDIDVSAHHADIEVVDGRYVLRDAASTNGTFVEGARISGDWVLRDGDVVTFGAHGPQLAVRLLAPPPPPRASEPAAAAPETRAAMRGARYGASDAPRAAGRTSERIATALREQGKQWRRWMAVMVGLLALGSGGAYWLGWRGTARRDAELAALRRLNDSLTMVYADRVTSLSGRVAGLDSALSAARSESERLQAAFARAGQGADTIATQLAANERKRQALLSTAVSYEAIAQRNGPAVTLIAVEWPDGKSFSGTGFNVREDGEIVTNRHLVVDSLGRMPRQIGVIFSDTRAWLPAHVMRSSPGADLALLRIDAPGEYPVVGGIAGSKTKIPVGAQAAIIGFPLGIETPMEGSGTRITARSSLAAAVVSKHLTDVLQLDSYAGEGSSGSPVFNTAGLVIGVVYGGPVQSGTRIVYAVPGDQLAPLLAAH